MIGLMLTEQENKEVEYILRKEMDEMIFDLTDKRLDEEIKSAIRIRYKRVYGIFSRTASKEDKKRYVEYLNKFAKGK